MKRETCPIRGHVRVYFGRWDMYACLECDAWLSDPCGCEPTSGCSFARTKPPPGPKQAAAAGATYEVL